MYFKILLAARVALSQRLLVLLCTPLLDLSYLKINLEGLTCLTGTRQLFNNIIFTNPTDLN